MFLDIVYVEQGLMVILTAAVESSMLLLEGRAASLKSVVSSKHPGLDY